MALVKPQDGLDSAGLFLLACDSPGQWLPRSTLLNIIIGKAQQFLNLPFKSCWFLYTSVMTLYGISLNSAFKKNAVLSEVFLSCICEGRKLA